MHFTNYVVYFMLIFKSDYRINIVEVVMQVLSESKMKHVSDYIF